MALIAFISILALIVIAGQFAVILQCGSIHRRLGPRTLDNLNSGSEKFRSLVGRAIVLEGNSRFVFGSLTCGHCLTIIRALEKSQYEVKILLADAKNIAEVTAFRIRFPEITREIYPGKEAFESLEIKHLPVYVETDSQQHIRLVSKLTTVQQLNELLS